ncbi:MAG: NAD(P)H-dependent glycerol-3-phosphate dehydrogenase [Bacteroidales bacterium]|nr:NAD(P)H-dependent glycerol-3-phosphate dehydrogenase [Bacteroidales bacterium]
MENIFNKERRVAMIGSGSWATSLVKLLLENHSRVVWYVRSEQIAEYIMQNGHNPFYSREISFDPSRLLLTVDVNEAVSSADIILFCVPSAFFPAEVAPLKSELLQNKFIISAIKGMIPEENITIAEYFNLRHKVPYDLIGVISGPSHAEEVAMERLSYLTLSSKYKKTAENLCKMFDCDFIRTIPGTDIFGVEYAAVLKNIYAIAVGISRGLSYGDNFVSVLVTNSFNEMRTFLYAAHPDTARRTLKSAYLGDLLVTCYSQFSRNRTFGTMIGKGYSVNSAQIEMNMVAEGYYGTKCIYQLNKKYNVPMPIVDTVYRILYENRPAVKEIADLTKILL